MCAVGYLFYVLRDSPTYNARPCTHMQASVLYNIIVVVVATVIVERSASPRPVPHKILSIRLQMMYVAKSLLLAGSSVLGSRVQCWGQEFGLRLVVGWVDRLILQLLCTCMFD